MTNSLLQVIAEADRMNWCVRPWCTTCGARDIRSAVASITNLQSTLESVDLEKLTSYRNWSDALRVVAIDNRISLDWGHILLSWLPFASEHVEFADHVLFYLVRELPCDRQVRDSWVNMCVDLALKTKHISLLESLVWLLGKNATKYDGLIENALEQSSNSSLLRKALVKAGFVPSDGDIRQKQKRELSGRHLFGAIRRNDLKAIQALLAKGAILSITDKQGRTPLEYAKSLKRTEITQMLESAIAQQGAVPDRYSAALHSGR